MFKKLFFAAGMLCLMSGALYAQDSKVKVGIEGGLNLAKMSSSGSDGSQSTSNLTGFHAGVVLDCDLGPVSLQPGLFYSVKGGKFDASTTITMGSDTYTSSAHAQVSLNYLELPVNVVYKVPVGEGTHFFIGAGPYLGYGLSGKVKYNASATGGGDSAAESGEQNVTFGSSTDQYKALDFGANFTGGFRFKNGLQLGVSYGLGLSNISNESDNSTKNNVFRASLGFFF